MPDENPIDRLRAAIETKISHDLEAGLNRFRGRDWSQLTDAEAEVFELTIDDMPRLVTVFVAYEDIIGMRESAFPIDHTLRADVLAALPWLTPDTRSDVEFRRFAELFDVPPDKAYAISWKIFLWQKRQGYANFFNVGKDDL